MQANTPPMMCMTPTNVIQLPSPAGTACAVEAVAEGGTKLVGMATDAVGDCSAATVFAAAQLPMPSLQTSDWTGI